LREKKFSRENDFVRYIPRCTTITKHLDVPKCTNKRKELSMALLTRKKVKDVLESGLVPIMIFILAFNYISAADYSTSL